MSPSILLKKKIFRSACENLESKRKCFSFLDPKESFRNNIGFLRESFTRLNGKEENVVCNKFSSIKEIVKMRERVLGFSPIFFRFFLVLQK